MAAGKIALELGSFAWAIDRLPQWDPAKYGVVGARLADAVRDADLLTFVHSVNRSGMWPPLFPLGETPVFLAFGADYRVASAMQAALLLLTALTAFWAGRGMVLASAPSSGPRPAGAPGTESEAASPGAGVEGIDRAMAGIAGALTALPVLASPFFHLFGTLVMLEVPGALLLFAAVGAYCRSLAGDRARHWRRACAAATALFFLKYNYGLLWLVPLALSELWIAIETSEAVPTRRLRRWLAARRQPLLAGPWSWFVLAYLIGLASIVVTGGWELSLAGREVALRSIGNPLHALCLLFAIRHLAWPHRRRELMARYRGLGARGRTAVRWIVLPIAVWMLLPPHLKDFVKFVVNRSSDVPLWSLENLLFYPRVFASEFSPQVTVGIAVLVLAAYTLARLRHLPPARRAIAIALLVGTAAAILHPYKLPRFLFPLAPLIWLSAAGTATAAIRAAWTWGHAAADADSTDATSRPRTALSRASAAMARTLPVVAVVALCGWAVWIAGHGGVDRERLAAAHAERSVPATVAPLLDALADAAAGGAQATSPRSDATGSVVLGTWNDLSPGLVEWHCRLRHPRIPAAAIPRDAGRLAPRSAPLAILDRAARPTSGIGRILAVEALDHGPRRAAAFAADTGWAEPVHRALADDPRFALETELPFAAAGYRLRIYRVATAGAT